MKLAIVNKDTSIGGWRYLYMLVKSIAELRSDFDITIFIGDAIVVEEVEKFKKLKKFNIKIQKIECQEQEAKPFKMKKIFHIHFLDHLYNTIRKKRKKKIFYIKNALDQLDKYDAVFYSWPYDVVVPNISKPLFFIPHDFIFTHFFGFHSGHIYTREWFLNQRKQFSNFVDCGAKPIVSSDYIKDEFNRIFPKAEKKPSVVYLSSFNEYNFLSKKKIAEVLQKYDINNEYILYANNWALHKNMQSVLGAFYQVKQKYPNLKLIITGYGTEGIRCKCSSQYYLDHVDEQENYDVLSLGLLSQDDFSAVLQGAKMIINSSLCEAGSGSALDAWNCKIPVVFSSIPSFLQQLEFLGTKAEVFDPRNSDSIADAILRVLNSPELTAKNVEISYEAIKKYTWEKVARQYVDIFEGKIK